MGTDSIVDDYGWFIDDISVYGCKSPVPDTSIDKVKTKKAKGHKKKKARGSAKVSFSGASQIDAGRLAFECAVDKHAFGPCDSPEKLKKLKVGKHKVSVRAIDNPTGQADQTPATKKFKIKRKHHKKHHQVTTDVAAGASRLTTAIPSFPHGIGRAAQRPGVLPSWIGAAPRR